MILCGKQSRNQKFPPSGAPKYSNQDSGITLFLHNPVYLLTDK